MAANPFKRRCAGLLHPVSALNTTGPIGSLDGAADLLNWMQSAGLTVWQVLPLCPPDPLGSPYNSPSALAGNVELVGSEWLKEQGLSTLAPPLPRPDTVNYEQSKKWKRARVLASATKLLQKREHPLLPKLAEFIQTNSWTKDTALFLALQEAHDSMPWWRWPEALRDREERAIARFAKQQHSRILIWQTALFLFETQWAIVRNHAKELGIRIAGDLPIYVAQDSVDVWAHQNLFQLASDGTPVAVSGCPPDELNENGQHWGHPLYNWEAMAKDGYQWWVQRVQRSLSHCDALRLDHFIGFSRFWAIPAGADSAKEGAWQPGPGRNFFKALKKQLGTIPLFVEDLGDLDEATIQLRTKLGFPGMRVLQFGLDGQPDNPNHPSAFPTLSIAATGTHDSPTSAGWWSELSANDQNRVDLGGSAEAAAQSMVDEVIQSNANWAILPLADLLQLGNEARINRPGTLEGNWVWREPAECRTSDLAESLRSKIEAAGRK
jgi:4-alpha-glucanotransferase